MFILNVGLHIDMYMYIVCWIELIINMTSIIKSNPHTSDCHVFWN